MMFVGFAGVGFAGFRRQRSSRRSLSGIFGRSLKKRPPRGIAFRRCDSDVTGAKVRARTRTRDDAANAKLSQKNHLQASPARQNPKGCFLARTFAPVTWTARNLLKSPESDEGIQENPSSFSWSDLVWFWFGLEEFGMRRSEDVVGQSRPASDPNGQSLSPVTHKEAPESLMEPSSSPAASSRKRGSAQPRIPRQLSEPSCAPPPRMPACAGATTLGVTSGLEMAPQGIEKIESAPGNGVPPERSEQRKPAAARAPAPLVGAGRGGGSRCGFRIGLSARIDGKVWRDPPPCPSPTSGEGMRPAARLADVAAFGAQPPGIARAAADSRGLPRRRVAASWP